VGEADGTGARHAVAIPCEEASMRTTRNRGRTRFAKKPRTRVAARSAKKRVSAIPSGHRTVTPYLVCRNAGDAIAFYGRAFGAKQTQRIDSPGGRGVAHAEIKIGDSFVMITDENLEWGCRSPLSLGGTPASIHLYVADADAAFERAVAAGCTATQPPVDMFWGDRFGKLRDPYGHEWSIATHQEDVSSAELTRRSNAFFAEMAQCAGGAPA
jgi:uncharacterized glyoxalase superfamily protein PhnB